MDGGPNRKNKVAFSNISGVVWTGPHIQMVQWQIEK